MKRDLGKRRNAYQKAFEMHGVSPKALQWKNRESAEVRYSNLVADLDLNNKTILDIGCGFGDIIPFLEKKTKKFSYTGIDIVPEFINEAQRRYPEHLFLAGDWMKLITPHDIIFCSGVLNNKVVKDQYKYREEAISLLFNNAKEALAFNMAGGFPQPESKDNLRVYYVDSLKILNFCFTLTPKIILRHQYRKKDFTIVMFR